MFMPTMSYPATPLARALACCAVLLSLSACSSHPHRPDEGNTALQVVSTSPAQLLENPESGGNGFADACKAWQLNRGQVAQFFAAATQYPELPHRSFDHLPCEITGTLTADGQRWQYRINAAGTATWTGDGPTRYFGCSAPACAPLVLSMPDNGEP